MTDDHLLVEYLRRSYHAADGLWFVKVEEATDFDQALAIDRRVWEILAKIQARKARELLRSQDSSIPELVRCFSLKLAADGFRFETEMSANEARFFLLDCPWLALLRRAKRDHLAARLAEMMCLTEGEAWAREYGEEYRFSAPKLICQGGGDRCEWAFARREGHRPAG